MIPRNLTMEMLCFILFIGNKVLRCYWNSIPIKFHSTLSFLLNIIFPPIRYNIIHWHPVVIQSIQKPFYLLPVSKILSFYHILPPRNHHNFNEYHFVISPTRFCICLINYEWASFHPWHSKIIFILHLL